MVEGLLILAGVLILGMFIYLGYLWYNNYMSLDLSLPIIPHPTVRDCYLCANENDCIANEKPHCEQSNLLNFLDVEIETVDISDPNPMERIYDISLEYTKVNIICNTAIGSSLTAASRLARYLSLEQIPYVTIDLMTFDIHGTKIKFIDHFSPFSNSPDLIIWLVDSESEIEVYI